MAVVQVDAYQCEQCEHVWVPRFKNERPALCPRCKSLRWDKPPRKKKAVVPS